MVHALRSLSFVLVCSAICAVASERIFWFWAPSLVQHFEVTVFYGLSTAVVLWAIGRYRVDDWSSLLLATPLYAYVTEGVITPVMYSGGPFVPFFPIWFSFWHGALAVVVLLIAFRRWALFDARRSMAMAAGAIGLLWGAWASTLRLPENVEDPDMVADLGSLVVLDPTAFARYAAIFTALVAIGHYLLGWLWPRSFRPHRWTVRIGGAVVWAGAALWSIAFSWALPMFALYSGLQIWALRRRSAAPVGNVGPTTQANLFEQLHGRVRLRSVLPIMWMAPSAAATYALLWLLDPSVLTLQVGYYGIIAVQTLLGAALTVWALRSVRRRRTVKGPDPTAAPTQGDGLAIELGCAAR